MSKHCEAIKYFEEAIQESDEIIAECTPALQAELANQKEHFVVALSALREKDTQWIPASERIPEDGDVVLMWHKDGFLMMAISIFDEMEDVTHWRPLPAGPKEEIS